MEVFVVHKPSNCCTKQPCWLELSPITNSSSMDEEEGPIYTNLYKYIVFLINFGMLYR